MRQTWRSAQARVALSISTSGRPALYALLRTMQDYAAVVRRCAHNYGKRTHALDRAPRPVRNSPKSDHAIRWRIENSDEGSRLVKFSPIDATPRRP
jgi:hypothetical protein